MKKSLLTYALDQEITNILKKIIHDFHIPGMSIAIQQDSQIVYQRGFGLRNMAKNLPMTPSSIYGIASTSKTFAALGILQLVEKEKIHLNNPIADYIDFKLGDINQPITIHHCLSHGSGLAELNADAYYIHSLLNDGIDCIPVTTRSEFFEFINGAQSEIVCPPGQKFMYNNDIFKCLSLVIEAVSGTKYADYIHKNILKPLKMTRSDFDVTKVYQDPNVITGYYPSENDQLKPIAIINNELIYADGGLFSTDLELQNFIGMFLNNGTYNGDKIINSSLLEKMFSPQNAILPDSPYGADYYGYGIFISDFFGHKMLGHGGNFGIMSSDVKFIPELGLGVSLGMNIDGGMLPDNTAKLVLGLFLGKDLPEILPAAAKEADLEKLCGTYFSYNELTKADIRFHGGILWCEFYDVGSPTAKRYPLIPVDLATFRFQALLDFEGMNFQFTFTSNQAGTVMDLQFDRHYLHKDLS